MNLVPVQYRTVSMASLPVPLDERGIRQYLIGRPAYRRTRYIIARNGAACALAEVAKESDKPLFSPITEATVLAGPDETALVDAPEVDTAVPTELAGVAARRAPGARCVIVRGRYGHVSFILDPAPIPIRVLETVPPWPPKLVDQITRVLGLAEDLPPVKLLPDLVDLGELARRRPASHYLFPCRAGQGDGPAPPADAAISYLDEIPERAPWTLVGCARSESIHRWFYGNDVPVVDMCPRTLARRSDATRADFEAGHVPVLTKCCLLEERISVEDGIVVVPWGATLAQIREGLERALALASAVAAPACPRMAEPGRR